MSSSDGRWDEPPATGIDPKPNPTRPDVAELVKLFLYLNAMTALGSTLAVGLYLGFLAGVAHYSGGTLLWSKAVWTFLGFWWVVPAVAAGLFVCVLVGAKQAQKKGLIRNGD